jgi:hypothetical protein
MEVNSSMTCASSSTCTTKSVVILTASALNDSWGLYSQSLENSRHRLCTDAPRFAVSRESILALDACLIDVCLSREGFRRLTIWWYLEPDRTRGLDQYFVRNVFQSLGKKGTVQFFIVLDFYNRFLGRHQHPVQ